MAGNLLTVELRDEQDVVLTRQRTRHVTRALGFSNQDQTSMATAVSEIARNAVTYGRGGKAEFSFEANGNNAMFSICIHDQGPGIAQLKQILDGQYRSTTGMGIGIMGSRRLCDRFEIESEPGRGTTVVIGKRLTGNAATQAASRLSTLSAELARQIPHTPFEEIQQQNRDLLLAMEELRNRQAEVERLNAELSETNRGALALYADLDQQAESLKRASELKSRFLSDMSHELRTPLNAMISISRLLLDRTDGDLTAEQEKQVSLIRKSAESLREMVGDLLDLAKIEAGRTDVHLSQFTLSDLLTAVRGMFRPLFTGGQVALVVEEPSVEAQFNSDEQKLSQVIRNLVSNAMKFTEKGEVRVTSAVAEDQVTITVHDTGIGLAPQDQERVFQDFIQVDSPLQRRSQGTGLGLPLTRKLVRLLGGEIRVTSEVGAGSTFEVTIPTRCPGIELPPQRDSAD